MKFDAIIIGFGKAGKTLAGFLAKKGEKVAPVSYTHLTLPTNSLV